MLKGKGPLISEFMAYFFLRREIGLVRLAKDCASVWSLDQTAPVRLMGSGHPGLALDPPQKIRRGRDAAKDSADMPFAGNARGNRAGGVLRDDESEPLLRLENTKAVMAYCEVPRIGKPGRGF